MNPEEQKLLHAFNLPFGQEVQLHDAEFTGGVRLLRLRIREKSRFTTLDLDPATAREWGEAMTAWADAQTAPGEH